MRKTLFVTAALAALTFAGAASAQSVTLNRSDLFNASGSRQVANTNIGAVSVGSTLTGGATAVGLSLNVESADNIFATGRVSLLNASSGQNANLSVNGANAAGAGSFTAIAGGNAASFSADDDLIVSGVRLANDSAQLANVTLESTYVGGDVTGGATAFGNSLYGETDFGNVAVSNGSQFHQANSGAQIANTTVNGGNNFRGATDLRSLAVGGILEFDSAGTGTYAIDVSNSRGSDFFGYSGFGGAANQTANMQVNGGSTFAGATSLAATAINNVVNLSGNGNITAGVNAYTANSVQTSNLTVTGSNFGSLSGVASSIGSSVSINTRP